MIFLLSLLTFLYKSRMVCEKIRRRTMENCGETHTSMADEFEEKAKNVDLTTTHPHSSCYDGLMEQTELLRRARKHQEEARKIFLDIDKEGKSIPADSDGLSFLCAWGSMIIRGLFFILFVFLLFERYTVC